MATAAVRIPITNLFGGGDYTAQIAIGSEHVTANVILDTGSSTLAVVQGRYNPKSDTDLKATALAQDVIYGSGGWAGPVVETNVILGAAPNSVTLDTYLALTDEQEPHNFGQADGIMGLAYNALNNAYNLTTYLGEQKVNPALTYPWPFPIHNSSAAIQQFASFLSRMPQEDLPPYFTALETEGIEKNIFSFYTRRSMPSMGASDPASDPLNNGTFILGGGFDATDLYTGEFVDVAVVDDAWYNTDLVSVQVGTAESVAAQPLPSKYAKFMISNSIVDSGTNSLYLSTDVFAAVTEALAALGPTFKAQVEVAGANGQIPSSELHLASWPAITFNLKGESGEPVAVTCAPDTYWQLDAPAAGQAALVIFNSSGPQSILGLPLLNNYFTIFDRSLDPYGTIRFAPIKAPA